MVQQANLNVTTMAHGTILPVTDVNEALPITASGMMSEFLNADRALTVMMEGVTTLQEHRILMARALGNAAGESGAHVSLHDFATEAGRMHRRVACINVHEITNAHEVNVPVATTDPAAMHATMAHVIAAKVRSYLSPLRVPVLQLFLLLRLLHQHMLFQRLPLLLLLLMLLVLLVLMLAHLLLLLLLPPHSVATLMQ